MRRIVSLLPEWAKVPLRRLRESGLIPVDREERFCPVCGNVSHQFSEVGIPPRKDAKCDYCGSLERHRFAWLYISRKTNLFDGTSKKMLHIAPARCFEGRLKERLKDGYLTADLFDPRAMVKMDITHIEYPDQSFDVIYCSHVLEHVPDDRKGMREFFRVLKNDGWALLIVPISSERTFEDPSIVEPMDRLKSFGQEDHVRRYGPDYVDRLREAGFKVEITTVNDLVNRGVATRMGLTASSGLIHYCTK